MERLRALAQRFRDNLITSRVAADELDLLLTTIGSEQEHAIATTIANAIKLTEQSNALASELELERSLTSKLQTEINRLNRDFILDNGETTEQ